MAMMLIALLAVVLPALQTETAQFDPTVPQTGVDSTHYAPTA
jgi:hypothetical protein